MVIKKKGLKMNREFWQNRYKEGSTGWDIGYASTPIKDYIDQLSDKDIKILVPGAGNSYEAEYLYRKGFTNVYVLDIAATPLQAFKERVPDFPNEQLLNLDFFELQDSFDLIIEQTFFCALPPTLREAYARKMHELLLKDGKLVGLFFDFELTKNGPPFGGDAATYKKYFRPFFNIRKMERAYNSIQPRQGNELFFIFTKKNRQ